ncbi:alpha-keto acid decarboxylase family protein [Aspergillus brunneoviolaceus CBS 621.78]|uniref:Pyruvate decarboxylase n=1 Tax=Aspergillus brunneoviolaceus CBS 621.78 TaxID=1450534 RepID=A0ACD1FU81_9EURO|nr:pyruvate decarboxylase [Aspergillus brunneoviolaceus CBS 621.78]RAH40557.1 pyruvate decarboxylase [Aspergillus brunneoviolaceus CBS 621.78]
MPSSRTTVSLAQYLFTRIKEVGIRSVHGVPGDYNLVALDYVSKAGLRWIGNCNELNAGYAADGYARVHGISALMTVAGVGELSVSNAIAGAYAEYVPIVHIVGQPSLALQKRKKLLHHSLGDGDFESMARMSQRTASKSVKLQCVSQAPGLIDEAISHCWKSSRPVSIVLPTDMVHAPVMAEPLSRPLDMLPSPNDSATERWTADAILRALRIARQPILLVGGYNVRFSKRQEVQELAKAFGLPVFLSASGRGIIDEDHPCFHGLYLGDCSDPSTTRKVRSADLIISVGNIHSDLNVASVSWEFDPLKMVEIRDGTVQVQGKAYHGLNSQGLLQTLVRRAEELSQSARRSPVATAQPSTSASPHPIYVPPPITPTTVDREAIYGGGLMMMHGMLKRMSHTLSYRKTTGALNHDWLWPALGEWLQPGDTIIAETGTSNFGIWSTRFPRDVTYISQYVWASVGYSLGACQGAAAAVQDSALPDRRTVLFIGDGSFQFTCQELSTIVKNHLTPIIFVICNNGYTVERLIHGWHESYNDIQEWKYRQLLEVFGAEQGSYQTYQIHTKEELAALLQDSVFNNGRMLRFVELHLDQNDAPSELKTLTQQLVTRDTHPHPPDSSSKGELMT